MRVRWIMEGFVEPKIVCGSLLSIGNELLLGDILDTNAHHIARELRVHGFRLRRVVTVEDEEDEIARYLLDLLDRSDFVIITGGLGPTDDDRTRQAVAGALGRPLTGNREHLERLHRRVERKGIPWSEHTGRLACFPEGAVHMAPELPMAGFFLEHRGVPCYFLPGVPHEMETLLARKVIPDLDRRFPGRPIYVKRVLRVQELVESEINRRLASLEPPSPGIEIGYLPQIGENWVTILVRGTDLDDVTSRLTEIEERVVALLGPQYVSGSEDEPMELTVGRLLSGRRWKLAAAESCTGGLLARRVTAVPGASDYFERGFVTYSNEAKVELLGVFRSLLDEHGAVSAATAEAMARGARESAGVDVAVSITGIAGPTGGSAEKPVGTVFMACSTVRETVVRKHLFWGGRTQIQERAAHAALVLLWRVLLG
ncbi:CinA family nicotinamide mononucleotide deamidase-related protein [Desulfoglaeba alkanexedens ALDC]|uniref:CinA-like protein n=1 Tax=Desulfoglaeba alkanexedens ALDC TaxID=980445 RepID=A0A4P8L257_9BACT|nr:CinA family nicotinamide mononucleotide deamidase-related protein [Desulfoglaeba alkanexedens ALDC]